MLIAVRIRRTDRRIAERRIDLSAHIRAAGRDRHRRLIQNHRRRLQRPGHAATRQWNRRGQPRVHIMLVSRLQRLRRIAIQIKRPAQTPACHREQTSTQLGDRLVHIRLAHSLYSLRCRHQLRLHLRQARLRHRGNHPVLRRCCSVAQVVHRRVIEARGRRSHIRSQVHAHKSIRRNLHSHPVRTHQLAVRRGKGWPA